MYYEINENTYFIETVIDKKSLHSNIYFEQSVSYKIYRIEKNGSQTFIAEVKDYQDFFDNPRPSIANQTVATELTEPSPHKANL